jgi:YfiH family protein
MRIGQFPVESSKDGAVTGANLSNDGVEWLSAPGWDGEDWLWHGFSTRRGGVSRAYLDEPENAENRSGELNLGFTAADLPENVRENRLRFAGAITGDRETPLATVRQVHSNLSVVVPRDGMANSGTVLEADGVMTGQPCMLLGIQTADCIPVLVADPVKRAVAAFHAGWRGTVERIVELGVGRIAAEFGSHPEDLIAAIGPGIGACCYTVGGEVRARFAAKFSYAEELFLRRGEDLYLNLVEANRRQLLAAGLVADAIAAVGGCTACQPELFYSHRASGGHAGRMMAVIGIR